MHPDALAALHARAMVHGTPWSAAAFADTLAASGVFLLPVPPSSSGKYFGGGTEGRGQRPHAAPDTGFVLGRALGDEAELLTIAVDPSCRRQGLGRTLLSAFEAEAERRGAASAFLEVAEDNAAALALYLGTGWAEAGRRRGYYTRVGADPMNALVLRKSIWDP